MNVYDMNKCLRLGSPRISGGVIWELWFQLRDGHPSSVQTRPIDLIRSSNLQALSGSLCPAAIIPLTPIGTHKPTRSGCSSS